MKSLLQRITVEKDETFEYYRQIEKRENVRVLYWKKGFNFSAINNFAVKRGEGRLSAFPE